ncbi:peroxisomal membrane protein 2 [Bombina bombina]|uniref:peroxisomal membrane protein 2 n=1 Tax=Bombina bombina TaxID=8345 RepID=UPI00235A828E|nr:peroxisomal membrane protein 2 [Bombina bombina]
MPQMSKPVRELKSEPLHLLLIRSYLQLLKSRPLLTKAVTSGILSALGNLQAQAISKRRKGQKSSSVDLIGPLRYAAYGFLFTGPLSHFFYLYLEQLIPSSLPLSGLRRLLLDRLIFAPAFLLLFFTVMNILEGKDLATLRQKLKDGYWRALKMNWKVWTPFQFINVTYIPVQFRVLFANVVAFFWYTYLASIRK